MIKKLLVNLRLFFFSLLKRSAVQANLICVVWVSALKCFLITFPQWSSWTGLLPTPPLLQYTLMTQHHGGLKGRDKRIREGNTTFIINDISYLCHHLCTTGLFYFPRMKTNPNESSKSVLYFYSHLDAAQHTKTNTTHRHISYQGNTN